MLYRKEKRSEVQSQNPGLKEKELSCLLGKMWKDLPEEEKTKYKDLVAQQKAEKKDQPGEGKVKEKKAIKKNTKKTKKSQQDSSD